MIDISVVNDYSSRGWVVHPLSAPNDEKTSPGKRPLLERWTALAKTPEDIEKYLKKGCNIGLVCGKPSGLTIIDIDSESFVSDLTKDIDFKTLSSYRTSGRGHLYFKYNPNIPASKHHDLGLEILTDGNNVVLPYSIHHTGDIYKWKEPDVLPIEMPLKLIDNLNTLFKLELRLSDLIQKCRPCFRKYWGDKTRVSHGATARMFLGAFCSELYNNGADYDMIRMFAKIIYQQTFNEKITRNEFNGWTEKGYKPFPCDKIRQHCPGFTQCDSCPVGKEQKDVVQLKEYVEMEYKDIMALHIEENERKCTMDLPADHFLSIFKTWMSSISDGYVDYQYLCGLWLLSALTSNKVKLRLKQETVKPNLWVFNIGKSTTSRKSTIVNKARTVYEIATGSVLYNEDYSIEGYLETLSSSPILNNVRDEAAGLMAKYHKKYNEGILELECAVYDGQSFKKTLASGKGKEPRIFEVNAPFVTKLYATTPDNFARYMTIDDFTCGYGFRFLFASPNYKRSRMGLDMETDEDIKAWGAVITKVREIAKEFTTISCIDFKIAPEAMEYYNKTVLNLENSADEKNNDILNSAIGRSQIHILKIAMLIELGKSETSHEIKLDSIKIACEMVIGYFLPSLMDIIDRLQEDVKFNQIEKIITVLRKLGGVASHSKVLHDCKIKGREFDECIDTMRDSDTIAIIRDINSKVVYYRLLNSTKILSIHQIHPVLSREAGVVYQENLENLNKLREYNDISIKHTLVEGSNYIREFREFGELGEFTKPKPPTSQDIVTLLHSRYDKMNKPENKGDLLRLKSSMNTAILTEFDTDDFQRYVDNYCHARQWE